MDFVVGQEITGLSYPLKWSGSDQKLVKTKDTQGLLTLTPALCDQLSKLQLCQIPLFPNEEFIRAYKELTPNPQWPLCLPKDKFVQQINSFAKVTNDLLEQQDLSYFNTYFKQGQVVFDSLTPANIDLEAFNDLSRANPEDTNLLSFKPVRESTFTHPILYTRTESVTGRLKVLKGPQILHVRREHRKQILAKSRFGSEGKVYEFDYKCLEPRVLLGLQGLNQEIPVDIYAHAHKEVFKDHVYLDRDKVKMILLTSLYGGSVEMIADESTLSPRRVAEAVSALESYFGIEVLRDSLIEESRQNNFIFNKYGRKVSTLSARNGILVNYYTQSTAMTVAELGFSRVVGMLMDSPRLWKWVAPLFVITDALYVDMHKSVEEEVVNLVTNFGSKIPGFNNVKFHLQPKVL